MKSRKVRKGLPSEISMLSVVKIRTLAKGLSVASALATLVVLGSLGGCCSIQDRSSGITAMETVELGGLPQVISIRGQDAGNPILLFLHGGPGVPEMPVSHLHRDLEKDFTVVHWDQRGAGKSYSESISAEAMQVNHFVDDTLELSRYLLERFGQQKLYLAGFSFGSLVAALAAEREPELFHAYIGISQFVNLTDSEALLHGQMRKLAVAKGDRKAIGGLENAGPPPYANHKIESTVNDISEKLVANQVENRMTSAKYIWLALQSCDYSITDFAPAFDGIMFSDNALENELYLIDLSRRVTRLEMPVYFFSGRHDWILSSELMERFFHQLEAPAGKQFLWFEKSDHPLHLEECEKYRAAMRRVLRETHARTASRGR